MARGPTPISLRPEARAALETLLRRRGAGQALVQRARIVLACPTPGWHVPWASAARA